MEFLVEFEVTVPKGTPEREVQDRDTAESAAAGALARDGHLIRLWRAPVVRGKTNAVGVYTADSRAELDSLLSALPLSDWMRVVVTPLTPHPNDPVSARTGVPQLPEPRLQAGFDYLYFLTDSTGHAHFSKTLAQHNQCQVNLAACPTAP